MLYKEKPTQELSRNERHLLKELRGLSFGSMTIHVKNGEPYRIEERVESVLLGTFTGENDT